MTAPARTVFLGSGAFAVPIAEALAAAPETEVVGVVTAPPRRSGRGLAEGPTPVGAWAAARGLLVFTPRSLRDPQALPAVAALRPSLFVLADYGRIVPAEWLALPRQGALNVHPSLLPRHRGASPIPAAILAGDTSTGVTLMRMDEGLDTGPIVAQRERPLQGDELAPYLEAELASMGAALLQQSLRGWLAGTMPAVAQPQAGATLTRPLTREQGRLDPGIGAAALARQVRAFQPWPGSFVETDAGRLVVWRASARPSRRGRSSRGTTAEPGTLVPIDRGLGLATSDGVLELLEVQRSGGRRIPGGELLRGHPGWLGHRILSTPGRSRTA